VTARCLLASQGLQQLFLAFQHHNINAQLIANLSQFLYNFAMAAIETLQTILKNNGYSITKPRQIVFEKLLQNQPLNIAKLAKLCARQIDRASVYRTVTLFEKLGIVTKAWLGFKSHLELSEAFSPHHHHLTCLKCGAVIAVEDRFLENNLAHIAARFQFEPTSHQVEISGLCAKCKKSK
jgi:Fur family transcriptional regulator, ferric uptake regulator